MTAALPQKEETGIDSMILFLSYGKYGWVMRPVCILGRAMHMASANAASLSFDAYSLTNLVTTAFGGGVLAPLVLGARPAPLMVDAIVVSCLAALFLFTSTGFPLVYSLAPFKVFGLAIEAMFRVNLIASIVHAASAALPSRLGPIVCGSLAGIGGMFLPFTKGIDALKPPLKPPIARVVLTSLFIAVASRPEYYFLSGVSPLEKQTVDAIAVACNALYDVIAYLATCALLFASGGGGVAAPTKNSPNHKSTSSTGLFMWSVCALFFGAAGFAYTESLGAIDAAYLSACTLSTVGGTPATAAGRLFAALLSVLGVALFSAAAVNAYASQLPSGPISALIILVSTALFVAQLEDEWTLLDAASYTFAFATTSGSHLVPKSKETKAAAVLFAFVAKPALLTLTVTLTRAIFGIRLVNIHLPAEKPHAKSE